jgi:hypothetical protein
MKRPYKGTSTAVPRVLDITTNVTAFTGLYADMHGVLFDLRLQLGFQCDYTVQQSQLTSNPAHQ